MSRIFNEQKRAVPVTLVEAGPCFVAQIKTKESDGYDAVQIGLVAKKKLNKPQAGHQKNLPILSPLREFKAAAATNDKKAASFKRGDEIKIDIFTPGDRVRVSAISKGKGFAGVVKRHGFAGGPASHGQKHSLRAPGSIGAGWPQRVWKGLRMGGRLGGERISVQNLPVVAVDAKQNILALGGAIPGRPGTVVEITAK